MDIIHFQRNIYSCFVNLLNKIIFAFQMNSCIVLILKTVHILTLKQTLTWAVLFYCRRQTVAAYNWGIFTQTFRSGSAKVCGRPTYYLLSLH